MINDYIEELPGIAEQALEYASAKWDPVADPGGEQYAATLLEKHAQLIIQLCATYLVDELDENFAAEHLLDHFGVKQ